MTLVVKDNLETMGKRSLRKQKTSEEQKKDFVKKNMEAVRKETSVRKSEQKGMDRTGSTCGGGSEKVGRGETDKGMKVTTREGMEARGRRDVVECGSQAMGEDNSDEGEVFSEDKKEENSGRMSTSTSSSEISCGERARREIRDRNMKKFKMVKTRHGLKYDEDLTEDDKKQRITQEDLYKHTHIGVKTVEASLIPSARAGNNEANKSII